MSRPVIPLILSLLIALLLLSSPVSAGPNQGQVAAWRRICGAKSPTHSKNTLAAISQICSKDFSTSTPWAFKGKRFGLSHVFVYNKCPAQEFVPKVWCEAQFLQTCAEGGARGFGSRYFNAGCQQFNIENVNKW